MFGDDRADPGSSLGGSTIEREVLGPRAKCDFIARLGKIEAEPLDRVHRCGGSGCESLHGCEFRSTVRLMAG